MLSGYTFGLAFRAEPAYYARICIPETLTCPFSRVQSLRYETPDKTQERP